jgi:hypothetical protein
VVTGREIVVGVVTRTGSAVAIALGGLAGAPEFAARREFALLPAAMNAQPYHAAAGLELAAAEAMIRAVERSAEEAAAAGLRALPGLSGAAGLPAAAGPGAAAAGPGAVCIAVAVKAVSLPAGVADIMRSHAWMHAAEGVLYREAVLGAARRCGYQAHAVDLSSLPAADQLLGPLGRAAGRPWRRIEKDAARAALTLLPG